MTAILPEGWERRELADVVTLASGGTPNRANAAFWGGGTPWVTAKDLKSFDLHDSMQRLTRAGADEVTVVPPETVLILVRGMGLFKDIPIGITAVEMTFNQDVKALLPKAELNSRYLAYALTAQRNAMMGRVDRSGHGTGRLTTDYLGALPIDFPPVCEQSRIVAVLGSWDRAIIQMEQLIAALRLRKAALMQTFFRGMRKQPLLDAANVWFSGVDKKSKADEEQVLLCNYMDVFHNTRITSSLQFMRATASKHEIANNALHKGDVVFTKDSETAEEIAEPTFIAEEIKNLVCGYHLAIARPREGVGHGPFIAQAMRHPEIRHQFCRLANGVVRFGLTIDAIESVEIFLPDLDAQKHIASVLDTEDSLIEGLARRAELVRAQKRGLMQKLLTGQYRLDGRFDLEPEIALAELAS